ncbi:hypothetical protein B0H19DRAFT_1153069 [Mycena capillaripes]|nr:hypothetical protein B0H19DRAFT_1153069 [Mycena capillaripes]
MRLTAAVVVLAGILAVSFAAPVESDYEARSILQKRPVMHNGDPSIAGSILEKRPGGSPTSIQGGGSNGGRSVLEKRPMIKNGGMPDKERRVLQKRPVIQNGNPSVEGPVLEARPVGNPTMIESGGERSVLEKRPPIQNGTTRRDDVPVLQKRPVIKNGGCC